MLLAFDVGNTNIVCGVYKDRNLIRHWRVATDTLQTADGYAALLGNLFQLTGLSFKEVEDIIISTVVPPIIPILETMSQRYFHTKPILVGPGIKTGIKLKYENPREIGADRIVNVVGAYEQYGGPLIVIDIGTATTFDVVDTNGDFLGGVISPGLGTAAEGLFQRAAKLPRIELVTPKNIICRNTINGMQAGLIFGFAGHIEAIVHRIKKEYGREMEVVATGGFAKMIAKESTTIDRIDYFLTLTGLRALYERNQ